MSSFFKKFKSIHYAIDGYSKDALNILTAAVIKRLKVDQTFVYQKYTVQDGMTPEGLANSLYKNPDLGWVFLLVNGITDPLTGWAIDSHVLPEWVRAKYGDENMIVHFLDMEKGWLLDDVDQAYFLDQIEQGHPLPFNIHPVTALEHESNLNLKKSEIVVISPKVILQFVDMFNKVIEGKDAS